MPRERVKPFLMATNSRYDLRVVVAAILTASMIVLLLKFYIMMPKEMRSADLERYAKKEFGPGFTVTNSYVRKPTLMANQGVSLFSLRSTSEIASASLTEAKWVTGERATFSGPKRVYETKWGAEVDQFATTFYRQRNPPQGTSGTLVLRWDKDEEQTILLVDVSDFWFREAK